MAKAAYVAGPIFLSKKHNSKTLLMDPQYRPGPAERALQPCTHDDAGRDACTPAIRFRIPLPSWPELPTGLDLSVWEAYIAVQSLGHPGARMPLFERHPH